MSRDRIILFHGTSSIFLPDILENGLRPEPAQRMSQMADGHAHLASFPGAYFAADASHVHHYARMASRNVGGEPMVITVSVRLRDLVPDEDEVLYTLGWPLAEALGMSHEEDTTKLANFGDEAALMVASDMAAAFGLEYAPLSDMARHLAGLVRPVLERCATPAEMENMFHPDMNSSQGWSSPDWIRSLGGTSDGLKVYREHMDGLCRSLAGADPDNYPCGLEAFKARLVDGLRPHSDHAVILGIGAKGDLVCHLDRMNELTGEELAYDPTIFAPSAPGL